MNKIELNARPFIISQAVLWFLPLLSLFLISFNFAPWPASGLFMFEIDPDSTPWGYEIIGTIASFLSWGSVFFFSAAFVNIGLFLARSKDAEVKDGQGSKVANTKSVVTAFLVSSLILSFLLCFLFIGGFIQGELFPRFGQSDFTLQLIFSFVEDVRNWGKLAIWSFIVGYYDNVLPDIFGRMAKMFSEQ